jgi:DNA-binding NtrC family response regulator
MAKPVTPQLSPITFLQTFVVQSLHASGQQGCAGCEQDPGFVEYIGLTAGPCFEDVCRKQMGIDGAIDLDQYADIILRIKNQIGGNFSRTSSESGSVRVVNSRCPFGELVNQAPELCRMTSSVFGGIAARNFGYAKVELRRRIATGDTTCDVCIYTDRVKAADLPGDEYHDERGTIVSRTASSQLRVRVEEELQRTWCSTDDHPESGYARGGPKVVAESAAMRRALEAVEIVAPTDATVLITGETGVGKEVVARAVHAMSARSGREFVAVNCGAIPENLVESALFGHEKGAFTGAYDVHHGFFERAERGTLFLDEINSLPLSAQVKLLRTLHGGEFERVGGRQTLRADVRIIAAANCDIKERVEAGEFRSDLYYRLNVVPISIPPLRERREDLNALVHHLLRQIATKYSHPRKMLGERAWNALMTYDWPGNVRELENVLDRSFLFARGPIIEGVKLAGDNGPGDNVGEAARPLSLRDVTRQAAMQTEAQMIRAALQSEHGNVSAVARQMGITARAVHQKLRKHDISARDFRKAR